MLCSRNLFPPERKGKRMKVKKLVFSKLIRDKEGMKQKENNVNFSLKTYNKYRRKWKERN